MNRYAASHTLKTGLTSDIKRDAVKRSFDLAAEIIENKCIAIHLLVVAEWQQF